MFGLALSDDFVDHLASHLLPCGPVLILPNLTRMGFFLAGRVGHDTQASLLYL